MLGIFRNKFAILILIFSFIIIFVIGGIRQSTYRPGWELSTELVGMKCNNIDEIFAQQGVNIQWDADDPAYGMPDIKATVSDVREENPKVPYQPLEKDYEEFKYIIEYHEYLFDVQVRTIANVKGEDVGNGMVWIHETSFPHEWVSNVGSGGNRIGENFYGGVYVRFSNLPWGMPDFGPAPENYSFNGYWLGIMNAKVETQQNGVATPDIEITDKGWVRNIESVGSQLNMFCDDGTFTESYAEIPWDITKVLDPDIENVILVYLPFDLMAGAWSRFDGATYFHMGAVTELKPVDYYVTYTVRMECLVVREYEFRDPALSPNPSPINTPQDYVPYTPYSFWDKYGFWIVVLAIIIVGGIILFSMVSGIGVLSIFQRVFRFIRFEGVKG